MNLGIIVNSDLFLPTLKSSSAVAAIDKFTKLSTKKPCLNLSTALLDSAGIVKSFVCFSNKFKEV